MIGFFAFATQPQAKKLKATASLDKLILLPMIKQKQSKVVNGIAELPLAKTNPLKDADAEICDSIMGRNMKHSRLQT